MANSSVSDDTTVRASFPPPLDQWGIWSPPAQQSASFFGHTLKSIPPSWLWTGSSRNSSSASETVRAAQQQAWTVEPLKLEEWWLGNRLQPLICLPVFLVPSLRTSTHLGDCVLPMHCDVSLLNL
ncbi:Hypothetical predicted protein [Pelobates cultripes]|uniref:Uncharacterized protein n=1 Tax=Pelobates cultripes TaxID=61616 RepID=A0AAD1T3Y9_PELCU|nr:Hypothetical predicted protein [Pelobates cultripes]